MTKKVVEGASEETPTPEGKLEESTPTKVEATPIKEPVTSQGKKEGDGGEGKIRTFTQDEVNELMGKVRGEAETRMFKKLGVESLDDIVGSLDKLAQVERDAMTEQERLQADLQAKDEALESLTKEMKDSEAKAVEAAITAEIARLGADKFASVDAVIRLVDWKTLKIDEEGKIQGVQEALDKVAEIYPFTLRQKGKVSSVTSSANPEGDDTPRVKTDEEWRQDLGISPTGSDFFGGRGVRVVDKTAEEISEFNRRQAAETSKEK